MDQLIPWRPETASTPGKLLLIKCRGPVMSTPGHCPWPTFVPRIYERPTRSHQKLERSDICR